MTIIVVILVSMSLVLSYLINDYFWGSRKRELVADGTEVAKVIASMKNENPRIINTYLRSIDRFLRARIWIVDKDKKVVATSLPLRLGEKTVKQEEERKHNRKEMHQEIQQEDDFVSVKEQFYIMTDEKVQQKLDNIFKGHVESVRMFHPFFQDYVITVGVPIKEGENIIGALLLNAPIKNTENILEDIYYYIGVLGLFAVLLSLAMTQFLSRHIVKPLVSMRESAAAMVNGDYSRRVNVKGKDEVSDLGRSLNLLASDLNNFVDKTQRMEQLRRDFVANVSHELRTPITVIRGYNEALLDGTITDVETAERYRTIIRDETIRVEELVKELLDISRLQARVEIVNEQVPLDFIAFKVVEKLTGKAQAKDIEIKTDIDENAYVNGIGDRLIQLVMILTDNAIKYSNKESTVALNVKVNDTNVVLTIKDTGIGISAEELPKIWERFYKVDKSHSKLAGGSGLGLAIAKEIIELHNAKLDVQSTVNVGTTIQVTFAKYIESK